MKEAKIYDDKKHFYMRCSDCNQPWIMIGLPVDDECYCPWCGLHQLLPYYLQTRDK